MISALLGPDLQSMFVFLVLGASSAIGIDGPSRGGKIVEQSASSTASAASRVALLDHCLIIMLDTIRTHGSVSARPGKRVSFVTWLFPRLRYGYFLSLTERLFS